MRTFADRTGTLQRDRLIAITVAVAVHGLIGWQLARLMHLPSASPKRSALEVQWIAAQPVLAAPSPAPTATPARSSTDETPKPPSGREAPPPPPPVAETAAPDAVAVSAVSGARPLSAVYIAQAGQWAAQAALPAAGPRDRFESHPGIPAVQPERFRMRESPTPADVVAMIGKTFGGGGEHPCDANRREIAGYATGSDAKALALAVDFERRSCRP